MGMDVFDPDSDELPDFCRDVLGWQKPATATACVVSSGGNAFFAFVFGAFFGLAIGFTLGTFSNPAFILQAWR